MGTFNEWFTDGSHFQTTAGTSVYTYTSASVKADLTSLSSVQGLGGEGGWFWNIDTQENLAIYAVGASATAALSVSIGEDGIVLPSGTTLGLVPSTNSSQLISVDLSGASPVQQTYALPAPMAYPTAFAATSAADFYAGNRFGVLLDGTSLATSPTYLTYGTAISIAGGGDLAAIATASGRIVVVDVPTDSVKLTINSLSNDVQMSADGTVLAAGYSHDSLYYVSDESLTVYSLPSGSVINSWPYTAGSGAQLINYTLAPTGTLIAQVTNPSVGSVTENRQVMDATGGSVLWSDSNSVGPASSELPSPLFSPDGTLIAVSNGVPFGTNPLTTTLTTDVYQLSNPNVPYGAAPGFAVGWVSNTELLVNAYNATTLGAPYSGATLYSPTGTAVATTALPQLVSLVPISSASIYAPAQNSIYSLPAGMLTFGEGANDDLLLNFSGQVGGTLVSPEVVFPWGSFVVAVQD